MRSASRGIVRRAATLSIGLVLACATSADAQPLQLEGPQLAVNVYTTGNQGYPDVACSGDGRCVVVWMSEGQDGDDNGVYRRRYDELGSPTGGDELVNATMASSQAFPSVCMNASGRSVVAWSGFGSGEDVGVFAQIYDSSGATVGAETLVNTYTTGEQLFPKVACFDDDSFVVTWTGVGIAPGQDGNGSGVYGQRFDSLGVPVGSEFLVNTSTTGNQARSSVSAAPDGSFVVAWASLTDPLAVSSTANAIRARRYDASGAPLAGQFLVDAAPSGYPYEYGWVVGPDVSHDSGGGFVVAWSRGYIASNFEMVTWFDQGRVAVLRYNPNGTVAGFSYANGVSEDFDGRFGADVAADDDGFVVVWEHSLSNGGPGNGTLARPFDLAADPESAEVSVSGATDAVVTKESIACVGNERYLVAWSRFDDDGDGSGVFARYLCSDADLDTVCGYEDSCPNDALDDADSDGFCADVDNCPLMANAGQQDADGDTVGDVCDSCLGFDDLADGDDDAIPDACDECPSDPDNDMDADDVCGDVDNCATIANTGQEDGDGDSVGDPCDRCTLGDDAQDIDLDAIPDACDLCVDPEQNPNVDESLRLVLKRIHLDPDPSNDRLSLRGKLAADFPPGGQVRPDLHGARFRLSSTDGTTVVDVNLPPGDFGGAGTAGWKSSALNANWIYLDKTATPPGGIRKLRMKGQTPNGVRAFTVTGKDASYPATPDAMPLRVAIEIGSVSMSEGLCRELQFVEPECEFSSSGTALDCRR